ncbi:epoxide hydrolase 4-like [Plakobranchus ocellatus]|uniref:Epoxide hydrolase 4-like n=1 Tax=Plakobranchus ocellatus TaxID=259542 RepID=A0AAV3YMU8_9GAST|nr:epoxide hydrolase 4-like [Plakobranchus ocellatus]
MKTYVWSVLLYGRECRKIKKETEKRLETVEMWFIRGKMRMSWTEKKSNELALKEDNLERSLIKTIRQRPLQFLSHICRYKGLEHFAIIRKIEGKRSRGRKKMAVVESHKSRAIGKGSNNNFIKLTENKSEWTNVITNVCSRQRTYGGKRADVTNKRVLRKSKFNVSKSQNGKRLLAATFCPLPFSVIATLRAKVAAPSPEKSKMAQPLGHLIMIWVLALFYGSMTCIGLIITSFKVGVTKFWNWKVHEKPGCLSDETFGTHGYLHLEDVRIHYVISGPEDKPLMLFMHGFPEFWYSWRNQIKEFQKDYRVVAFDMRGYNESDKPKGLAEYTMPKLMKDVKQVILALGYESCILVGHDWGGAIAWGVGRHYPECVDKLIVMNAPPGPLMQKLFFTDSKQRKMSWYMFLFQLPYLPELLFKVHDFGVFSRIFKAGKASEEDLLAYKHVFSQPGALTGPLNYYRASMQEVGGPVDHDLHYTVPVLLIWGCQDSVLSPSIPGKVEKECTNVTVRRIETAEHFVQNHAPEAVNNIMREWLAE